jgi:hypothetical protein
VFYATTFGGVVEKIVQSLVKQCATARELKSANTDSVRYSLQYSIKYVRRQVLKCFTVQSLDSTVRGYNEHTLPICTYVKSWNSLEKSEMMIS